jgi:BirA family transcriptional regulator, biotin operon repressor / biotin---[acetyl-CoA-carboxylase] ligase
MNITRKHFPTIDSTNTWAKQNALTFDSTSLTLVTADQQTCGRGRFKRRWESPPYENIYASYCLFLNKHRTDIGNLPQTMGISIVTVLQKLGFQAYLKWPNDIMLHGKKLGGILTESTPYSDQLCLIIGVGLNVNMPLEILKSIDQPATSLFIESDTRLSSEEILSLLNVQFAQDLDLFLEEGFVPFFEIYQSMIKPYLNQKILFHDNKTIWEGYFHSINPDGTFNLKIESGELKTFVAGEILPKQN